MKREIEKKEKLFDDTGEKLELGDTIAYQTRDGKDMIAEVAGMEDGLVVLKNLSDGEEYKRRVDTFEWAVKINELGDMKQ